ncbi:unnamed protein product [Taenia asiatica]|uniref:Uncharacterized protein n=1 Tax=Taenia asiatica TaxID=60517 RepID=A0A0R3VZV3_TAEAS|nr:unnamed protein product [Taenia asiatica]
MWAEVMATMVENAHHLYFKHSLTDAATYTGVRIRLTPLLCQSTPPSCTLPYSPPTALASTPTPAPPHAAERADRTALGGVVWTQLSHTQR